MDKNSKTANLLTDYCREYDRAGIRDVFKFLFQSSFGCEHLVSSCDKVKDYLEKEYMGLKKPTNHKMTEPLDGGYCRLSLDCIDRGLSIDTFAKLFCISAKEEAGGKENLEEKLEVAKGLCVSGKLPFGIDEFLQACNEWKESGYPAVHHSEEFRREYNPAYRVISADIVPFLPIFIRIDELRKKGRVTVAIEGGSASGKSTLGELLKKVYGCTLLHTDDFFLQRHQRTDARFAEPGGNLDRERFLEEVISPLRRGERIAYRRFDCSTFEILPPEFIEPCDITVVEGAYSKHPDLDLCYDLSVFLDVNKDIQRTRINKRNSPQLAKRFFAEWIPMEEKYFDFFGIKNKCDFVIPIE